MSTSVPRLPFGLSILEGHGLGAGKSCLLSAFIYRHLLRGGVAYYSDTVGIKVAAQIEQAKKDGYTLSESQFRLYKIEDAHRIHHIIEQGSQSLPVLLVIDEAQEAFDVMEFKDTSTKAFFLWLTQSRHDGVQVIVSSQSAKNVAARIRRLTTEIIRVRNMDNLRMLGFIIYKAGTFRVTYLTSDLKNVNSTYYWEKQEKYFALYDTYACRGRHREESKEAEVYQTQDENAKHIKKMKLSRLILIAVTIIILIAVQAYRWGKNALSPRAKDPAPSVPVAPSLSTSPSPVGSGKPAAQVYQGPQFRHVFEIFKGTDGGSFMHTDKGEYRLRYPSAHGVCVLISRRSVLFKSVTGDAVLLDCIEGGSLPPPVPAIPLREFPSAQKTKTQHTTKQKNDKTETDTKTNNAGSNDGTTTNDAPPACCGGVSGL